MTYTVDLIRELPDWGNGDAALLRGDDGQHYVVSSVDALFTGFETLIFRSDEDGEVEDFIEVGGGRGQSREEAIDGLRENGPYDS